MQWLVPHAAMFWGAPPLSTAKVKPCDTGDEHAPRCAVQQPAFQRAMSVEDTLSVAHPPLSLHCPLLLLLDVAGELLEVDDVLLHI